MPQTPSDITLVAQAIGSQRGALLAYGDDASLEDMQAINDGEGFTIERVGGLGSTLRIEGVHLSVRDLRTAYRRSDEFLRP